MLEPDTLQQVVFHFRDPEIAAVQGELETLNPDENAITRLSVLNDFIVNIQQLGRDRLNLFVPLLGTNQYIRRSVLEELGYWDSNALSEDTEISLRLARKGYKVKYVPVKAMVEAPAKLKFFVKQRMKWLRGYTQAAMKHMDFVKNPNWKTFDAQLMLLFPLMLIIGLIGYAIAIYGAINFGVVQTYGIPFVQILGTALLLLNLLTSAMVVAANPKNAVYVPLLYLDWILLASVSLYVHIRALLRKPQKWTKTPKSGHITVNVT
jgi:cellulose synthase/poly-beta-1,6-N-acetylglucosamine synthase-like glycosyltransferase